MWQLSQPAQALARRLYALQADRSSLGHSQRNEQSVTLLHALADLGELAGVVAAANCLLADAAEVKDAARAAIHRLLIAVPPEQFALLGSALSWPWAWTGADTWRRLSPARVGPLAGTGPSRVSVLALLSGHPSGYVRHEAVRLLGSVRDGSELPYVLLRLNDWVDPISADARALVLDRLTEYYVPHVVRALPLVLHLLAYRRRHLARVVEGCVGLLVKGRDGEPLTEALRAANGRVRRDLVRITLGMDGDHRRRVVEFGLACDDPVVRLWCARQVRDVLTRERQVEAVAALQRDPSMPVRREGLVLEAEAAGQGAVAVWQRALLDRSASIRELARFHLKQLGGCDPALIYRDALGHVHEGVVPVAAVLGLGETGDATDLPLIRGLLGERRPAVLRAAVRALAMLGQAGVAGELVAFLLDENPGVVREACRRLMPLVAHVTGGELLVIAMTAATGQARESAVRLMTAMGKWQSLPWLMRTLASEDGATRDLAREAIERWFSVPLCNKVFTRPTAEERRAIDEAIAANRAAMGEEFARKLRAWLG